MTKNKVNHSIIFLRKIIFLLIQIAFFVECGRLNQEIQKEARLQEAKNTLKTNILDTSKIAKALGLSYGPDALQKSLMKLLNCTKEEFDEIFPDYDNLDKQRIDKQKLKEHLFQTRIVMESFYNNFPVITEKLDKVKFFKVNKLCNVIEDSKRGVVPEGSSLIISVADALFELFTNTAPNNSKKSFQNKTCLNEYGQTDYSLTDEKDEFKSVDLKFASYTKPGTIGELFSGLADYNNKPLCYPGQILEIMKSSITIVIDDIMKNHIDPDGITLGPKKYTRMQLQSILNNEASKLIGKETVRKDKDENGKDTEKKVYMTVSEILKEVMNLDLK